MNNKIVILDDSVILYQHYIDDTAWEKTMGFPRGGLTYLISNNNIKFYAFIDYFYRNCLMTMDLPLYIVDEELGIDGEYDDISEITEILNRIFPALNGEVDLTPYLKKREAAETYQPIGDYFDGCNYNSDTKRIEFYAGEELACFIDATDFIKDGMVDSVSLIELSGDTYLHVVFNSDAGKEPIDIPLGDLFDIDNYYTKAESDERFQPKGEYLTKESGDTFYQPIGEYLTKESGDTFYQPIGDYLTKESGDTLYQPLGNYQPAGDYALKSEIPSLDGYATQTWVQNQGYINQIKTINNQSLIGTGNINIGSGGTIDAYTKAESDERFQPKGDYVSNTTFITFITNLTQQITSLQEALEECCTGQTETLYRWITLTGPNDYICSGTTKYAKEQKQQSTDNGATWQNVSPAEYRMGALIETDSTDCGWAPTPQYRWKAAPTSDYMCSGTSKYYKVYYEVSYDSGATWQHVVPEQTKRGDLIEANSPDCGYIEPQYRWYQAPASDYICSGTSKYYKEYYQVSNDGGATWTNVSPEQTRRGALIEADSTDCGFVPVEPKYRWADTTAKTCSGYNKVYVARQQVSYDGGNTWQNTPTTGYGSTIEAMSYDCGYVGNPKINGTTDKGNYYQVNCNGSSILTGAEIERVYDSHDPWTECTVHMEVGDCVTSIGTDYIIASFGNPCLTSVTLANSITYIGPSAFEVCSGLTSINMPSNLQTIQSTAFSGCKSLTSIDIPSTIKYIGTSAFLNCSGLQSIIIRATTPPTLGGIGVFENNNNCPIYVPASSINAYKTAEGWINYASRIQPIP